MASVETWKQEIKNMKFERIQKMGKVYVKQKRLGRGAFGEGWLCADRKHKRMVVVKIATGAMFSARDEFNAKKEVALMESLDHPNIVKFHEAWIEGAEGVDERLHIAMEYCDAGDLGTLLKARLADERNVALLAKISRETRRACESLLEGKRMEDLLTNKELFVSTHTQITQTAETIYANAVELEGRVNTWSLPELESWLVQLLWGLWYIHKKRVVHRDIKPENIFLSGGGKIIKIGDFGISGLQSHTNANLNTRAGTPLYMAPEMWDNGTYTDRVDVFALGAMFYELCGLVRAFDARFPTAERWPGAFGQQSVKFLKRQIIYSAIRPMALPQTQIESSFFEVVRTMTRKSADIRPTAGQVLRSIRIQLVARRVIDIFSAEGEGCPSAHPLLLNSDARHHNVHNPADNQYTLHDTARFQCSVPDAEVLIVTSNVRVSIRAEASSASPVLGFLFSGDIIEVHERQCIEGTEWVRFQNGWCVAEHDKQPLTAPCPEELLSRDPEGIKALGARMSTKPDQSFVSGLLFERPATARRD
ncbi:Serine/threonine-protein kinase nekl-2 [Diplonema papillatum]|nr:Serine/threonine-protein kinase nekl-2 [Diplonema papillatum]